MKILTFGSRLSKLIAEQYVLINGGQVVSSVLANRTDFFNFNFINNGFNAAAYDEVAAKIASEDAEVKEVLLNQHRDFVGKGSSDSLQAFFELNPDDVDLIVLDNQVDLEESLYYLEQPQQSFFLPANTATLSSFTATGELSVEESVAGIKQVADYLSARFPKAKLLVVNHPVTNDRNALLKIRKPDVFAQKQARADALQQGIQALGIYNIPGLPVSRPYQTRDGNFFTVHQYCAYAGMLFKYVYLN
jgi:hypothetical protein